MVFFLSAGLKFLVRASLKVLENFVTIHLRHFGPSIFRFRLSTNRDGSRAEEALKAGAKYESTV